jgi:hypothetical protein
MIICQEVGAMRSLSSFFFRGTALAFLVFTIAVAQEKPQSVRLTIALSQKPYQVGEPVVVTYRITNASSSLLCLPPPSFDCYSISGELAASATPPKGVVMPKINGGCAADRWMDRDAGHDIDEHWIKLPPQQSHEFTSESHLIGLIAPGRWVVEAGYTPAREDTLSLNKDAMKERGCSVVPGLQSEKVVIEAKGELK